MLRLSLPLCCRWSRAIVYPTFRLSLDFLYTNVANAFGILWVICLPDMSEPFSLRFSIFCVNLSGSRHTTPHCRPITVADRTSHAILLGGVGCRSSLSAKITTDIIVRPTMTGSNVALVRQPDVYTRGISLYGVLSSFLPDL